MARAAALLLIAAFNASRPSFLAGTPALPLPRILAAQGDAGEEALFLSLGMRRLLADLWMARLLLYYGAAEAAQPSADAERAEHSGSGAYPEIAARAAGILALDPSYTYAALYAAGALGFNLGRPEEGIRLLTRALAGDPGNWRYRAYIGALGFVKNGDTRAAVALLEPTLGMPDCPMMIKSMTAYLLLKLGDDGKAGRLYRIILATAKDPGYQDIARKRLEQIRRRGRRL